jgi:hypothetical protein
VRCAAYLVVLVLAVELSVWEAFLVASRPWGVALPVSALLAFGGNLALGRAGASIGGQPRAALPPGLLWVVVAFGLAMPGPLGDVIVPGSWRGTLFLVAGVVAAVWAVGSSGSKRASGATPEPQIGR